MPVKVPAKIVETIWDWHADWLPHKTWYVKYRQWRLSMEVYTERRARCMPLS